MGSFGVNRISMRPMIGSFRRRGPSAASCGEPHEYGLRYRFRCRAGYTNVAFRPARLPERDKELVMGQAVCDWWSWNQPA